MGRSLEVRPNFSTFMVKSIAVIFQNTQKGRMEQQPHWIVDTMFTQDAFSQWLGIERIEEGPGQCVLQMRIRPEMTNGFGIAHGGISFALADSALAFASNAHGRQSVSVETSISHLTPIRSGDVIVARTIEEHLSHKIGIYQVRIERLDGQLVALFKGTVYRSGREWQTQENKQV